MAQPPLPAGARLGVDVRCGLLIKEGKTMRPDERKGLLRVLRTEDGLVHLQWHVRPDAQPPSADPPSSPPEHDAVVFPGEARFEPLPKGPPRVWALRFAAEKDRNLFFWMQEPDAGGDEARGKRVDALINAPLPGMEEDQAEGGAEAAAAAAAQGGGDPWLTPADALARAHEAGALGAGTEMIAGDSVGLLAQGPGQRAPVENPGGDAAAQLAALLSGMAGGAGVGGGGGRGGGGFGGGGGAADPGNALAQALAAALARSAGGPGGGLGIPTRADPGPTLLDVLRPDAVAAALTAGPPAAAAPTADAPAPPAAEGETTTAPAPKKSPLEEAAERLAEFLPEGAGQRGAQGLIDNVRSPQFRAQVASLAHALATGQIDLAATFGLTSAQGGYSMHDFVRALEDLVRKEKEEREKPPGGG